MLGKLRFPSPALVVAILALFVALGGTAVAAGVVPLAKRALVADNAKKVGGKSAGQVVTQAVTDAVQQAGQQPGPASTATGLVSTKTVSDTIPASNGRMLVVSCDTGKKVTGGGWSGLALGLSSGPVNETGWSVTLLNIDESPTNVTAYAICVG